MFEQQLQHVQVFAVIVNDHGEHCSHNTLVGRVGVVFKQHLLVSIPFTSEQNVQAPQHHFTTDIC
jgi:hypothetical protein